MQFTTSRKLVILQSNYGGLYRKPLVDGPIAPTIGLIWNWTRFSGSISQDWISSLLSYLTQLLSTNLKTICALP